MSENEAEPGQAALRATQTLALIEAEPINPDVWERLAVKVKGQNDPLSIKSLEIIIEGLKALREEKAEAKFSTFSLSMFIRLSKAYNSPTLLKEVGLIYLRDLGLPHVALHHFERALRLDGPEKELRPLIEASAVAVQRQLAARHGQGAAYSGITTQQHAKPIAPTVIRKTGKLLLPTRFTHTAATKISDTLPEVDAEAADILDFDTPHCLQEAAAAIKNGRFKRARALLEKANEKPADKLEMWQAWTNLGQACYEAGQHPMVETSFYEAMKYDPNEMASHFNLALGYHLNRKYNLALASYQRANQIEPKHPKVWCNLGVLYFQMDQFAQAESALRYATLANRDYARAWDNLAAALGAQDKLDEAVIACERATALRPDYPEVYFKLGVVHFSKNDLPKAADHFRRSALLPSLAAYSDSFLAMVHARLEQTEASEAAVHRAAKADPKCDLLWMAWNDLGQAWYSAGDYHRAANAYGEATMLKPDEPEAWFNLGVSYHQIGDLKAARDSYQHAVDLKESMAGAWHNLGIVCAQKEDHGAAMTAFRREVHWAPNNVRAWYDLGVTLQKLGRDKEAAIAFAKVDTLTPGAHPSGETAPGSESPDTVIAKTGHPTVSPEHTISKTGPLTADSGRVAATGSSDPPANSP
ncbi:MAG TPA: tetratricopeptide repeat protein [Candidatus Methylacidiphilales bacterium]|nr:tetratricopeptide repeat protein [Candidatus Methylacidiphilales bacterium]